MNNTNNDVNNNVDSVERENIFRRFFNRLFNRDKVSQLQNEVDKLKNDTNMDRMDTYKTELDQKKENEKSINRELVNKTEDYFNHNFTEDEKINVYDNLRNTLDVDGWTMLDVVKKLIPCDLDSEFYTEDTMGVFAADNGNDLKKYYEIVAFAERQYEQIGAYEKMSSYSDYSENPEYLKYKDKLIDETIKEIINKHPVESMEVLKGFKTKQVISNSAKLGNEKNDIKITVLDVENKNVENYFKKGQIMTLKEANEKFKQIERSPQIMIQNSERLGLNHPYTKVGFKIELHDGDSFNIKYSFGTGESKSLLDYVSNANNEYLTQEEKSFFKNFKNESLLLELADNFKTYLYNLALNDEDKLNAIYDKFNKDYSNVDEIKKNPGFDLQKHHETMVETIIDLIQHKPIESIEILKEYIPNILDSEINVRIGKVDDLAKEYFSESEDMSLLEANERFKKADMEIASIINNSEGINYQTVGFIVDERYNQMSSTYSMGSMQRNDLIDLVEKCEYGEEDTFLHQFSNEKLLVKAFEAIKEISIEYLEREYELDFCNNQCANSVILTNDDKLMYVDSANKFGELEAFYLIGKNDNVTSYQLKKESSGLNQNCSIDFSKKHLLNVNDSNSRIKTLDKAVVQKIDSVKKALDKANLIKETNVQSITQRQNLKNSVDLSM